LGSEECNAGTQAGKLLGCLQPDIHIPPIPSVLPICAGLIGHMTKRWPGRMLRVVSSRAKALLIVITAVAILYVLISPLPEMAATSSTQPTFCFVLWLFPLFTFAIAPFAPVLFGKQLESGSPLDRSLLCSRLC